MEAQIETARPPGLAMPMPEPSHLNEWDRTYHRNYYRENRNAEYLTAPEREKCRANPSLVREIRGPEFIACTECGLLVEKLPQHVIAEHRMTARELREKCGLPISFPLCSQAFSEKMKSKRGAQLTLAGAETRFKKAALGGAQPAALPKTKGRRSVWQPHAQKASDWEIAERRLRGESQRKIATALKITQGAVSARLLKMGFPRSYQKTGLVLFHGEPLTRQHLPLLVDDWIAVKFGGVAPTARLEPHSQFTVEETAKHLGVSPSWVREKTRTRANLPVGCRRGARLYLGNAQIQYLAGELERIRHEELVARARLEITGALGVNRHWITHRLRADDKSAPLSERIGGKIPVFWSGLKTEWRGRSASARGGRPRMLLPSEEAILPRRYRALLESLKSLLRWLKDQEVRVSDRAFRDWICAQAKHGKMRTLLFWPEFSTWVGRGFDPTSGRGMDWVTLLNRLSWQPSEVAADFLASELAIAPRTLTDLLTQIAGRQAKAKST
jgi:predicted transcriptional regulator